MENLRWILLAAGAFFILAIYFVGRRRRRNNSSDLFDTNEDLPDFTARDWDELDEGVGEVRIIARASDVYDVSDNFLDDQIPKYDEVPALADKNDTEQNLNNDADLISSGDLFESVDEIESPLDEPQSVEDQSADSHETNSNVDIIVLYILAKSTDLLTGEKINSAAQANGLTFGSMNIFHRLDGERQTIFSLANMVEPGNFDPDTIHEMTTTGLTMFMQLSNLAHPADDFDEMLRCAYHMSEMLGASLCNRNRQPITQADAEYYRNIIAEKEKQ